MVGKGAFAVSVTHSATLSWVSMYQFAKHSYVRAVCGGSSMIVKCLEDTG